MRLTLGIESRTIFSVGKILTIYAQKVEKNDRKESKQRKFKHQAAINSQIVTAYQDITVQTLDLNGAGLDFIRPNRATHGRR
jgi:hypothetical protein